MAQRDNPKLVALAELAYLRRLQKYQRRKSEHIEHQLHWLKISCEARSRILHSAKDVQHELTESIQSGNRTRFSLLYHTFRTLQQACDEWDTQSSASEAANNVSPSGSFLDRVSADARTSLLAFLSRLSFDPIFLLDRLLGLSDSDFAILSRPYSQSPGGQSIFGSPTRRTPDDIEHASVRKFLDFSRSDLLSLLLRLIPEDGDVQDGPLSSAWGFICAGLLSHQKPGSDRFVIMVMNAHLGRLEKTAHHCMENWLLETLKDGDFLLYQSERRPIRTKVQPTSGHPGDDPSAVEEFFSRAISKLLKLLKDNKLTSIVPSSISNLGKSIVARLEQSSQQQQAAPYFLCTRWLFASYLATLITSPESYGLLLSHHISSTARQRILQELAHRARQIMEGVAYTWKQTSPIRPNIVADIESVVDLFRICPPETGLNINLNKSGIDKTRSKSTKRKQITLCASEVIHAIRALYPENGCDVSQDFHCTGGSPLKSSASSVSGLSLFRTMSPSEFLSPRSGHCDSVSEVGTSMKLPFVTSAPMAAFPNPEYETKGTDTCLHGLREAFVELSNSIGCVPGCGSLDLFSEQWTSLESFVDNDTISWIDGASSHSDWTNAQTNVGGHIRPELSLDPVTFNFVSTGIHSLLDGQLPTTIPHHAITSPEIGSSHITLVGRFEDARASCYHQGDFAKAHLFFRLAKTTTSLSPETIERIMQAVAHDFQRSIDRYRTIVQEAGNQIEKHSEDIDFQRASIKSVSDTNDRLREKMWYVSDIQRASHYEDLRKIVAALRVMATSSRPKLEKRQPLLRHRSASKSLNHNMQLKAEAATLELLSVPVAKGGTNKLSDIQVDMTLRWMQSHGVERVCRAEERIHRFCSELTRCLDQFVGQSVIENPILWSSELFQDQKPLSGQINGRADTPGSDRCALEQLRLMYRRTAPSVYEARSSHQWGRVNTPSRTAMYPDFVTRSMSPKSVTHDYFGCRSPTLTHKSSGTLWSTFSAGPQSPSSATSFPSRALSPISTGRPLSRHSHLQQSQASFLEELKQNLTSLLLSDFHDLFRSGSETDKAMRKTMKLRMPLQIVVPDAMDCETSAAQPSFDFDQAFRMLLRRFELQASPYAKLDALLELQDMLKAHRTDLGLEGEHEPLGPSGTLFSQRRLSLRIDTFATPRTMAGHDNTILSFRELFQNQQLRPKTLFRDLQYIASLVPLNVLDNTPRGRAFWNATIAALDLKEGICQGMIETADQIIHHHTFNRGHSHVTSAAQAERDAAAFSPSTPQHSDPSIADLSMSDAATLLQLTAKEGIPAAQRELATLYLTHPELLGICLSPFSKLRDVFKDVEKDREQLSERYDPVAMAVAQHWMELSAKGGDGPAARYLRAKDEFDRIP
ncbi:hypothetical protein D6D26_05679 [Aureobasidium pullulans]|nr:hypothetical protein D6D26_05679 [Aureobasidium pullulans]